MRRCSGRSRAGWAALKVAGETRWTVAILCAAIVRSKSSRLPPSISLAVLAVALLPMLHTLARLAPFVHSKRQNHAAQGFSAATLPSGMRWCTTAQHVNVQVSRCIGRLTA